MYHPVASGTNTASDFEFIELKNVGAQPLNLIGVSLTNGVYFTFTATNAITNLGPGQYLVLVANTAAFRSRYPAVTNVAGQYTGRLGNGGEHLYLQGALQEPILDFTYDNSWYPTTDGQGFSLVIRNEYAPFNTWTNPASWRTSVAVNGSPGRFDGTAPTFPGVVINEALTHTDPPEVDTIELYNPTDSPAIPGRLVPYRRPHPASQVLHPSQHRHRAGRLCHLRRKPVQRGLECLQLEFTGRGGLSVLRRRHQYHRLPPRL